MEAFQEDLHSVWDAESIISLGPDVELNKVSVELNAFDRDAIRRLYEAVPSDVLVVSVQPDAHYELLGGGRKGARPASP